MMGILKAYLDQQGTLVVDGALGTELERRGWDLNDPVWSARLLAGAPEIIKAVHADYLAAGADCLITASYQASYEGFMAQGYSETGARELIQSAVTLARESIDTFWADPANRAGRLRPLAAASVGPYGAFLADGSEYRGQYGLSEKELMDFHDKRMGALIDAGPDLMACETLPCLVEARALVRLLENYPGVEAWVSFSARDGRHINSGETVVDCIRWLDNKVQVAAVGINCTDPAHVLSLIREIKSVTEKPVVVYPNKGGVYDGNTKVWKPALGQPSFDRMAMLWAGAGARLTGGCCQTTPDDIRQVSAAVRSL